MKNLFTAATKKLKEIQRLREKYESSKETEKKIKLVKVREEKVETIRLDITSKTVIKVLLIITAFLVLSKIFVQIQTVLVIALICFFLSIGLSPIVSAIERYKVPRPLAILFLYIIFFGGLAVLFLEILPILAEQLIDIAYDLRNFVVKGEFEIPFLNNLVSSEFFDPAEIQNFITKNLSQIAENLQSVAGSTFSILSDVFQGVFNFIFALVLIFFILMEREQIANFMLHLFPIQDRAYVMNKTKIVQTKMAEWFRGQVILMIAMGLFMYAGMKGLELIFDPGMKYSATLGLLAAFMELFPYIGPLVTGLLAVLIAVNISWVLVVAVLVWMAIAQFLEGNFLIPIVMEKAVGLSSVVVMLALAIGGILGYGIGGVALSILGMILAVPIAASIAIFVEEYANRDEK
ncbi:MAG: AI-2E family transporter [Candidatus Peregrinibacteria bacterium]|nr:AI-2E family transporter [Candidatus Peregrinibacteria bacterium]